MTGRGLRRTLTVIASEAKIQCHAGRLAVTARLSSALAEWADCPGHAATVIATGTTPTLRCKDPEPDKRCSLISTKAVPDIWPTILRYFSGIVFCSSESNTHFGTPSWKAIGRYANCRIGILKPCIFSFPFAICGLWGSTPVASRNGVDKPSPPIGSPHSWISCCRGKRRNWRQGCSDQPSSFGAVNLDGRRTADLAFLAPARSGAA
jgi:hypothetical protein